MKQIANLNIPKISKEEEAKLPSRSSSKNLKDLLETKHFILNKYRNIMKVQSKAHLQLPKSNSQKNKNKILHKNMDNLMCQRSFKLCYTLHHRKKKKKNHS